MPRIRVGTDLHEPIADVTIAPVQGGPRNVGWTHPEHVNEALLGFPAGTAAVLTSAV
jgi:hypothetical protein